MIEYVPKIYDDPKTRMPVTAWGEIPRILKDIITRFNLNTNIALDLGTDTGYSATALSNYFTKVITVDTFRGDLYQLPDDDVFYKKVVFELTDYKNIEIVKSDFRDFIDDTHYDLVHVDMKHDYETTYEAGDWALRHADLVIFHDTISYPIVMQCVEDLALKYDKEFYNYPLYNGLGIL